ncbi:MAG: hypothetical protein LBQ22_04850 [Bacteroidales bacterium]|jgi:hypothetical protein|nr:hypothetical protein [Bacteroidales bacterium]
MKKRVLIFLFFIFSFYMASAQDMCMNMFPTTEKSVLISQCYDKDKILIGSVKLEVETYYKIEGGSVTELKFSVFDENSNQIEEGVFKAQCNYGVFSMSLVNSSKTENYMNFLIKYPQFVSNFLYYPIILEQENIKETVPGISEMEFIVNEDDYKVIIGELKVYNREYLTLEEVITPAAIFNANKMKFDFTVTTGTAATNYKVTEWYATGAGIVRLEVYDDLYNLMSYSELIVLDDKGK